MANINAKIHEYGYFFDCLNIAKIDVQFSYWYSNNGREIRRNCLATW